MTQIESALFPVLQYILQNDVTEFLPYIFQVLSLALEYRKDGVKGPYMDLFPLLLQPVLWERTGTFLFVQQIIEILNAKGTALLCCLLDFPEVLLVGRHYEWVKVIV